MSGLLSCFRKMTKSDLDLILNWRNAESVRRFMYTQHEISPSEHLLWFEGASQDCNRYLLIYEKGGVPLGFINIKKINEGGIADWGFYTAPSAPKGTGRELGMAALEYAFVSVGLHKMCGQALDYNKPSIKFHVNLGFKQEGRLRDHYFDDEQYHDVLNYGLLASEWQEKLRDEKCRIHLS